MGAKFLALILKVVTNYFSFCLLTSFPQAVILRGDPPPRRQILESATPRRVLLRCFPTGRAGSTGADSLVDWRNIRLFGSQGLHRIEARCKPRGNKTCERGHCE